MSIKRILAFVLLLLLAYAGVYMVIYGVERYMLFSGPERDLDLMSASELQPQLNVKGNIETVTQLLHAETVTSDIFGIPIGSAKRYYYAVPIGYSEDHDKQRYCTIAVSGNDDISAVEKLMKDEPVPLDPNAPSYELRGLALDTPNVVYQKFKTYLEDEYTNDEVGADGFDIHDIIFGANVDYNLVPYTIFVKSKSDDKSVLPISIGGACAVLGVGLFILLAIRTYKKAHMY